jgi:putative phage-type endonuclease
MKIVAHAQNQKSWYAWRDLGLGASEAPTVMEENEYQGRFELWLHKTKTTGKAPFNNFQAARMQRGHDLEDEARRRVEKQLGFMFPAVSGEHDLFPFIRASLDGYDKASRQLIEIKCPGKKPHAEALAGRVPKYYQAQVAQQFLVSGAEKGWYCSWDGESEKVVIVEVYPDPVYQARLLKELQAFWVLVTTKTPPNVTTAELQRFTTRVEEDTKRLSDSALSLALGLEKYFAKAGGPLFEGLV